MSFWGWVGAIATGWFVASVLFAVAWQTIGKRIFRKPPVPTSTKPGDKPVVFINGKRVENYEILGILPDRKRHNGGAR